MMESSCPKLQGPGQYVFLLPSPPTTSCSTRRARSYPSQATKPTFTAIRCFIPSIRQLRRRTRFVSPRSQSSDSTTEDSATKMRNKNPNDPDLKNVRELQCVGTGSDVECLLPDGKNTDATVVVPSELSSSEKSVPESESASLLSKTDEVEGFQYSWLKNSLEYLLLISPFFFWGTAMVAMKGVLPKAGPLFVAATRLIPSGFLLVGFAKLQNRKLPSGFNAWLAITTFALVDGSCFQGFLAEGLKRTSAGLGSVIIDSQPLTVAVLASVLFGETIGALGILGLATGVIGLLLLEVPIQVILDFFHGHGSEIIAQSSDTGNEWSIWDSGEWWMLLAAQSMAIGTVMVRWVCRYSDPVMATGWHLVIGGLPLLILSSFQHDPAISGHIQDLDIMDWLSLLYTSVFGSAVSYGVFFYNASRGSLTKLSSLTFLTPMFAAVFGYFLLDETLTPTQILGAVITLSSIYLINLRTSSKEELN